jgi:hypothetical protein
VWIPQDPIWSVHTLFFLVTSAHTLLGPFIVLLKLMDQTLCLDQLYNCAVIKLSSLCTPVHHFVVSSSHTLLGPVFAVQLDTNYTHLWCTHCDWISCTAVHLYFSPVSVYSWTLYTTGCGLVVEYSCFSKPQCKFSAILKVRLGLFPH